MGLFDFFKKKEKRTAGGSLLIKSGWKKTEEMIGVPDKDTSSLIEAREKVYEELFGPIESVNHELLPLVPHIDVYIHAPNEALGRPFYTLVTGGMSDYRMNVPKEFAKDFGRREVIVYAKSADEDAISLLRYYARFPYQASTWLAESHTIPNGDPPTPLFENSEMVGVLFLGPPFASDCSLPERLTLEGDAVSFLWMLPLTVEEINYKLDHGTDAIISKLEEGDISFVLDPARLSCV